MSRPAWKIRGLDPGIRRAVWALRREGIETVESCQGGPGHAFPQPTVCFAGGKAEGYRAIEIALRPQIRQDLGMGPRALRRVWRVIDGELSGPDWELTWFEPQQLRTHRKDACSSPDQIAGDATRSSTHPGSSGTGDTHAEPSCGTCGTRDQSARRLLQPRSEPSSPSSGPSVGDA